MKSKRMVRILSLVVVLSMILTTAAFAAPGKKDFDREKEKVEIKDEDYHRALLSLIEKEIVKGYGKGDYGLSGNVKRGDVIVMIIRALGLENVDTKELSKEYLDLMVDEENFEDFEDVENDVYYYGPIKMAKKLGIAKGDGRYFKPNKPVTIQETIWLIERAEDILDDDKAELDSNRIEDLKEKYYKDELNDFAKRKDVIWMLNYVIEGIENEDENKKADLTDIKLDMKDDSKLVFLDSWFNRTFNILKNADSNVEDLEYVEFEVPIENGTLYYDYDENKNKNTLVDEKTKYYLETEADDDDDKEIRDITLVPKAYFSGTITIKYNAFDEDGESYSGLMKITVDGDEEEVQELKTITLTMDEDDKINIDFLNELEKKAKLISSGLIDKLEYVKFKSIDRGELYIDYADHNGVDVELNSKYYFDHIDDDLIFEYTGNNTANIQFTVYDDDDKPYDGLIKIVPEEEIKIETINLTMDKDDEENIDFLGELEKKVDLIDVSLFDELDYVKFTSKDRGTLTIDYADKDDVEVELNKTYYFDHIDDDLVFKYTGTRTANIQFTVYDKDGNSYDGLIKITN